MERPPSELATQAYEQLAASCVRFPAGVFQIGARLEDLPRALRALDVRERLGFGALLKPTPARWVHLQEFSLAARPVTNGEYLRFLDDPGYEDPARWQRVFEDHPLGEIEHYTVARRGADRPRDDDERLRKTWETHTGTRSFLAAYVRSVICEAERELDVSPCYADLRSVWDDAPPVDRARSSQLAWTGALFARALGGYLPPDYRRDLAHEEREKLTLLDAELSAARAREGSGSGGESKDLAATSALPRASLGSLGTAWRQAFEALDAAIGQLRDASVHALREEGASRVAPELERGLVERDYLSPDFQGGALKILDRLRAAYGRSGEGERPQRIALRRVLYPLSWATDDPRHLLRERPDRLPWAERPVTGVSLHEALAYADWLTRASGERAFVRLPSEAQHERAASWPIVPVERRADGGVLERVDPRWKRLFAWESRDPTDPAVLSPDEPLRTFAQLAPERERSPLELEVPALRELVRRTSRVLADASGERRLEMLQGFHWEWTRDRLNELEPRYSQLDRAELLGPEHEVRVPDQEESVPVAHYCASVRGTWSAARGGPPRVGGTQLTTRRYGFYPLRGAPEIGFRLVLEPPRSRPKPSESAPEARA